MALSLTVPTILGNLPKDVEVNPKKAKAWVESLPLTKMMESTRALTDNLEALNHAKFPCEDRVALLEIYHPVIAVLLDELEAVYAYSSLPLPPKKKEAFDLARQLLVQCGYAYKMMLLEKSGKSLFFNARKSLPLPLFRAMHYLRQLMLQSYKTYYPVPVGVWQEMHSLYLYADEQGLLADVADAETSLSLLDIYIDVMMTSLADPYRLMYQEVDRVLDILGQNRGLMDMRTEAEGLNPHRLFVVALDSDQAPKVLIPGGRPPVGQVLRVVDPGRLVEKIQQRIRAQSGTATTAAASRAAHDITDLTMRLIRLWGDPPKRQFRRNPTDTSVALCSGIKAISYFTELASHEDPEDDAQAIRDGDTIPLLKIPQDPVSQTIGVEQWHVLNQSANGLRMHRETGGSVNITVGEVVGVRFMGGRTWNIGVVRWLTLLEGNALEFGIELIAPAAISITIEPTIGSAGKTAPALMLFPLPPDAESDTVLTTAETFSDLREFELNAQGDRVHVRATTLIERTSRFEMFQFQSS
jgi:hypothetical protein